MPVPCSKLLHIQGLVMLLVCSCVANTEPDISVTQAVLAEDDACHLNHASSQALPSKCSITALQSFVGRSPTGSKAVVSAGATVNVGSTAPLNQVGYILTSTLKNNEQMTAFIRRTVARLGGVIVAEQQLKEFVPFHGGRFRMQTFHNLLREIREIAMRKDSWVQLPPPNRGPVLYHMIRSDPWRCDLLPPFAHRAKTCSLPVTADPINPKKVTCGFAGGCTIEHANAYRTNFAIGALPCCPTAPFCAAPSCKKESLSSEPGKVTCTKRSPTENLAYLRGSAAWPAYHGFGGSFELDTLKFLDLLGCRNNNTSKCGPHTVDLVFDLGANFGYYTEKLTVRNFAKNYVMIEANGLTSRALHTRWGNATWKKEWFTKQVPSPFNTHVPEFEIVTAPLSNTSGERVNMCLTEMSMVNNPIGGCNPQTVTMNDLIDQRLSPRFKKYLAEAQSAFIKVDTEGMDELVLRGMSKLLEQTRGVYSDGSPRHLINFMQLEVAPRLSDVAKTRQGLSQYDIKSLAKVLEDNGFESFLIGPRYLPLSHGSWSDGFKNFLEDPENNAGVMTNFPDFSSPICPGCADQVTASFVADIFVMRLSHPRSAEIKVALGACKESKDFDLQSFEYTF